MSTVVSYTVIGWTDFQMLPYWEEKSFIERDFGVQDLKSPVTAVVVQVGPQKEIHEKAFRELWFCSCPHNETTLWHVNWAKKAAAVPYLCIQMHTAVLILRKHYLQLKMHQFNWMWAILLWLWLILCLQDLFSLIWERFFKYYNHMLQEHRFFFQGRSLCFLKDS